MTAASILADLERFEALAPAERLALASSVAELAGPEFRPSGELVGRKQMVAVDHAPTGLSFIFVPGGRFAMGLTERDLEHVRSSADFASGSVLARIVVFEEMCTPVHDVVVAPFLLATNIATSDQLAALTSGRFTNTTPYPDEVLELMKTLKDFRLPSESELEYAGREGGTSSFINDGDVLWKTESRWPDESGWGLGHMALASWTADEWHPNYDGAPTTSIPWRGDGPPGVYRGSLLYTPESEVELLFGLAAVRGRLALPDDEWDVGVRLARSIPL